MTPEVFPGEQWGREVRVVGWPGSGAKRGGKTRLEKGRSGSLPDTLR